MPRRLSALLPAIALLLTIALLGAAYGQAPATMAATQPAPPVSEFDDWANHVKKPCDYFKWGGDLRIRQEEVFNALFFSDDKVAEKDRERDMLRMRARIWGTVMDPKDTVELNCRMATEPRYYFQPEGDAPIVLDHRHDFPESYYSSPIFFDNLNVRVNNIGDFPLTIVAGRQDLVDKNGYPLYGDGWLVLDGTPLDGSRSIYFDAVRTSYDCKPIHTRFDLVYIDQGGHDDHWLPTINDKHEDNIEQNERGVIAYVSNKSIKATTLDGYFIYKHSEPTSSTGGLYWNAGNYFRSTPDEGDMYALGGKADHAFGEHWKATVQGAWEFGENRGAALNAFGAVSRLNYAFNDSMKNQVHLGYEYLSGDGHPGDGTDTSWKPFWGRWPQWSELYVYSYAGETRIAEVENLHRINIGWQFEPYRRLQFALDYHALFADKRVSDTLPAPVGPFIDGQGYFRGSLITAIMKYTFNSHVAGHLWGEWFVPGDFYASGHRDLGMFLRWEIMLSF